MGGPPAATAIFAPLSVSECAATLMPWLGPGVIDPWLE